MIWTIFAIWILFAITCAIIDNKTDNDVGMFLLLVSLPIMFYVPFMI